jgi:hypothetical protein
MAGLAAGVLAGGVGARVMMRIAGAAGGSQGFRTEAGFRIGEVSVIGSIFFVIFIGIFMGIVGSILYVVFRPWLEWAGPWRGLAFGVVLFAIGSASSDAMNPDNRDFFLLDRDVLNVGLIVALFLVFGVTMEMLHRRMDERVGQDGGESAIYVGMGVLGAAIGLPILASTMFTDGGCHCGPPIWAGVFTVVAGLGTLAWWMSGRDQRWRRPAHLLGWTGLIGATAFGLVRAISDAAEIIG